MTVKTEAYAKAHQLHRAMSDGDLDRLCEVTVSNLKSRGYAVLADRLIAHTDRRGPVWHAALIGRLLTAGEVRQQKALK